MNISEKLSIILKKKSAETYDDLFGDVGKPTFDQKLPTVKSANKPASKPSGSDNAPQPTQQKAAEKFK